MATTPMPDDVCKKKAYTATAAATAAATMVENVSGFILGMKELKVRCCCCCCCVCGLSINSPMGRLAKPSVNPASPVELQFSVEAAMEFDCFMFVVVIVIVHCADT